VSVDKERGCGTDPPVEKVDVVKYGCLPQSTTQKTKVLEGPWHRSVPMATYDRAPPKI
jgi:hypothetical protein